MKNTIFAFVTLGLLGCQEQGLWRNDSEKSQRRQSFAELAERGRRVGYAETENVPTASLTGFGLTALTQSREQGEAVWQAFNTTQMEDVAEQDLNSYARRWAAQQETQLGVAESELQVDAQSKLQINDTLTSIHFKRMKDGVPVKDAYLEFIFARQANGSFRLREVMNRTYGAITVDGSTRTPGFSDVVRSTGIENLEILSMEDVILPRVGDASRFQYGTRYELRDQDSGESYTAFLENEKAEVIEATSHNLHATVVNTKVHERSYIFNKMIDLPLPFAKYSTNTATVDADSRGEVELAGVTQTTIKLQSPRGTIYDNNAATPFSLSRDMAGNTMLITGNDNETRALNAYVAIHRINRFVRQQLKSDEVNNYLNNSLRIKINVNEGSCNAFYNTQNTQISLYAAGTQNGTSCGHMSLINDVIYHEWGHGLDAFSGKNRGISDNAFSEGIGDIVASYYTGSSNMGAGFNTKSETGIRNLQNTAKYPADKGEPHTEGTIIGGAFWDLRAALIQRYGAIKGANHAEMLFLRHLITTDTYTDSYQAVLRLDDNDGNTATKSPNYCLINKAFANHGLATDENCTDAAVADKYPLDASLNLAIKERGTDGLVLMASTTTAAQIVGCLGDRATCEQSAKEDIAFDVEGQKDGKLFFVSKAKVSVGNPAWITLIAKDKTGKITGARTLKIVER